MKPSDTQTFTKVQQIIHDTTQTYLTLGVALLVDGWDKHLNAAPRADNDRYDWCAARRTYRKEYIAVTSPTFVRAYLRVISKETKRPFVYATIKTNSVWLVFPKQKRLEPLYANFLLAPSAVDTGRLVLDKLPLYYYPHKTKLDVTFQGDAGRVMFNTFLERCRTDPDYRKALRTE